MTLTSSAFPRAVALVGLALSLAPATDAQSAPPAAPASFEGVWTGTVTAPNTTTEIGFAFTPGKDGGLRTKFAMPAMGVAGMPLGPASIKDNVYIFDYLGIKLTLADGALTGTFANPLLRVALRRGDQLPAVPPREPLPSGPAPQWSRSLGARLWASPVVHEGRIYLGASDGKFHCLRSDDGSVAWTWAGPNPLFGDALVAGDGVYFVDEKTDLVCLERETGAWRWRSALHDEKLAGGPAPKNPTFNHRTAVPVLIDGLLYVGSTDRGLYVVEAKTGKVVRRENLPAPVYARVGQVGRTLAIGCFDGTVLLYDLDQRKELRRTKVGGAVASTPVAAGGTLIVGCRDYLLYGLQLSDLAVQWRDSYWFSWVESVPRVEDGRLLIGGSDYRRISDMDAATGAMRWSTDVRGLTWGTPVATADTIFAGTSAQKPAALDHEGGITALDRHTGAVKWRLITPLAGDADRAGFLGSLALDGGRVIGAAYDGTVVAYPVK